MSSMVPILSPSASIIFLPRKVSTSWSVDMLPPIGCGGLPYR
jgi:hypothetical protein